MADTPPQRNENILFFSLLLFSAFSALSAVRLFFYFQGRAQRKDHQNEKNSSF